MKKYDISAYSWVIRGSQRIQMIKVMHDYITPTKVKKLTGLSLNNVSDNLRLFVKKNLAKCLNERENLGRIYVLTEKGKRIKNLVTQ